MIVASDYETSPVGGIVHATVAAELGWCSLWIMVVFGLFSLIVAVRFVSSLETFR